MPNEVIGGISVAITVDLPGLQAQFSQAQQISQAASQSMVASFNSAQAAATGLTQAVQQVNAAVVPAGQAASTAAGGFVSLGDAWKAIEAIGIGKAILEVGEASLEAYSNLQRATTALTALTGSATQANSEIKFLKQLAQDDALSFPELLQANQRLTALGVSATQIPAALRASADAAAAMNTSLINVTNAIDRMAASGSVAGRNLTQLGLTTNDLAKVMGVSLDQVSKKFHSLDESDRIAYLTEAMGKFGGTAEQVAGTLVGSFNRLENAITFAFQSIGQSIAPAAKDLTDLAINILPSVATAVSNLAAPAASFVELGKAVADAKQQFIEAATAAVPFGDQILKLAEQAGASKTSFMDLIPGISGVKTGMDTLTVAIQAYTNTGPEIDAMNKMVADGLRNVASAAKLGGDAFKQAWDLSVIQAGLGNVSGKISEVITEQEKANVSFMAARDAFNQMNQAFTTGTALANGHIVTLQEVQRALLDLDKAQKALNAGSKDYQDTLSGLTENYNKQQGTINTLENTIGQLLAVQDRTAAQDTILAEATTKLTALLKQQADAHGLVTAAAQGQGKAYDGLVKSADALMAKQIAASVSVGDAKAVLDQLTASTDTSAEHTRAVNDAIAQYAEAIKRAGGAMTDQIAINVNGVAVLTTVGDALNKAKEAQGGFTSTMVNGVEVLKQASVSYGNVATAAGEAKRQFDQLGYGAGNSALLLKGLNDQMALNLNAASQAIIINGNLGTAINHVGEATSDALAIEKAWDGETGVTVDYNSKLATSFKGVAEATTAAAIAVKGTNGALSQFLSDTQVGLHGTNGSLSQFASDTKSSMGQAQESFKATTGQVSALSVGVALLAMQMSGLTVFAGSGGIIDQNHNAGDLQHQLWLAKNAAGDPSAANGLITILPKVTAAIGDLKDSVGALGDAAKKATVSTTQYIDGLGNVYDSYQQMVDAIDKNPALGGLFTTVTKGVNDLTNIPIQALSSNVDGLTGSTNSLGTATKALNQEQQKYVDGLGNVYSTYQALLDALAANPGLAGPHNASGTLSTSTGNSGTSSPSSGPGAEVQGPDGKMYASAWALYQAIQANPNILPHEAPGTPPKNVLFNDPSGRFGTITGSNGLSLADALAMGHIGIPSGSESGGANPYNYFQKPQLPNIGSSSIGPAVPSNQQGAPGTVIQIINPVVQSQTQAEQVLSQAINYLRNTAGLKL